MSQETRFITADAVQLYVTHNPISISRVIQAQRIRHNNCICVDGPTMNLVLIQQVKVTFAVLRHICVRCLVSPMAHSNQGATRCGKFLDMQQEDDKKWAGWVPKLSPRIGGNAMCQEDDEIQWAFLS